jgi:hypothetical protein
MSTCSLTTPLHFTIGKSILCIFDQGFDLTHWGSRLDRRLGKGNRRTDVQRFWGQTTDERISTDLDCIPILLTHTIHTCISVSHGLKLLPTKLRPRSRNLSKKNQVKSLSVTVHPTISMSLSYKSTVSPSVVSKSS